MLFSIYLKANVHKIDVTLVSLRQYDHHNGVVTMWMSRPIFGVSTYFQCLNLFSVSRPHFLFLASQLIFKNKAKLDLILSKQKNLTPVTESSFSVGPDNAKIFRPK